MKIVHTIYDDARNPWCGGGGAVRAFEINRRLAGRHDILQITGVFPGAAREETCENVRFRRIGTARTYALSRLSYSLLLPGLLRRESFDLWVYDFSAFAPVLAPAPLRGRAVLILHHLMSGHALRKRPLAGPAAWAAERLAVRNFARIIAVSPGTAESARSRARPNARIATVPNGVDQACFVPEAPEGDYLLFFGRLDVYNKGIDLLISAFARIQADRPDLRLILAGRGTPDRVRDIETLAARAGLAGKVEVAGPVSEPRKRELFAGALFTCMPSRYEGWGITAVEAGAAGKAVVATDIPGLADAVCPDRTGLLVPPENPEALAGAMRRLLREPETRRRLGAAGRDRARKFAWERVAEQHNAIYEQALEGLKTGKVAP